MARKIFVVLLSPFIVLGITACPGAILDPIVISFDADGAVVGAVITFTSSIHGDAYMWEFGDGTTGNGKIVTHSYTAAGSYIVTLRVIKSNSNLSMNSVQASKVSSQQHYTLVFSKTVTIQDFFFYWSDNGADKLQRATFDVSTIQDIVVTGVEAPHGIALHKSAGKLYWVDLITDKIQRSNLDGSNIEDVVTTGLSFPLDVAIDPVGGKIYWSDAQQVTPITLVIQRCNIPPAGSACGTAGNPIETIVSGFLVFPHGIALDIAGGKIYWVDSGTTRRKIQRTNLDGTGVVEDVVINLSIPQHVALDVAAGKIYWSDTGTERIQRCSIPAAGSGDRCGSQIPIENLVTTEILNPDGIALDLDDGKIYWVNRSSTPSIKRANLDGSSVEDVIVGLNNPHDLDLF